MQQMPEEDPTALRMQQLEAENQRLRRAVEELSILNEVASAVSSASSLDAVIGLIVQKCVKHLAVEQAAVLLFDDKDKDSALRTMVRRVQSEVEAAPYRLNDQIIGWMMKHQAPLLVNDLADDARFRWVRGSAPTVRSLMCVPLRLKGRMIGVLSTCNKQSPEGFSAEDQRLLAIIASQSAQVIENTRLHEEEKTLQLVQQELRLAHAIQAKLLPAEAPLVEGYEIAGRSVPARNVGGDYFDYIHCHGNELAICVGDVSGKGIPAAVLMACVQATIRGQALIDSSAGSCMERANRLLHSNMGGEKFVTLFYGVLDWKRHELRYSNAGHNPPVLLSNGRDPQLLTAGGPVLGVLPDAPFEEARFDLEPGDLLAIYPDGFTEAMNSTLEEFGEQRLLETLHASRGLAPEGIVAKVFEAVEKHTGPDREGDDMTLVIAARKD
jgi:sigma-B regulation protein RsbU (phosphoserine phosphatase)